MTHIPLRFIWAVICVVSIIMKDDFDTKKYIERIGKIIFASFGVYIGVAIIVGEFLLFTSGVESSEIVQNPLFVLAVMIVSAPFLWKYMK